MFFLRKYFSIRHYKKGERQIIDNNKSCSKISINKKMGIDENIAKAANV